MKIERLTKYSQADAAGIGKLLPFLHDKFSGDPIDKKLLETIIKSPYHDQLVARMDDEIVGSATVSLLMGVGAGTQAYLEDFIINPDVQRQGIGSALWDEIIQWCREREANLELTSHPSRMAAQAFYRVHGATVRNTTVFHVEVE